MKETVEVPKILLEELIVYASGYMCYREGTDKEKEFKASLTKALNELTEYVSDDSHV